LPNGRGQNLRAKIADWRGGRKTTVSSPARFLARDFRTTDMVSRVPGSHITHLADLMAIFGLTLTRRL
ncbi:MAG TPA: hypothetical protein VIY86_11965, partial [Pirellulaceae bacterium]